MASKASFSRSTYLFVILSGLSICAALQVSPGSTCASVCLDQSKGEAQDAGSSTTSVSDIVCDDGDYWSSPAGIKYRNCLSCLQNSTHVSGEENDMSWYIYNVHYATDVCLYSYPNASSRGSSSPCDLAQTCGPLQKALTAGKLDPTSDKYEYCSADNSAFGGQAVDDCSQCLRTTNNQTYLANFIVALQAGCEQKPAPGVILGLQGSLFSQKSLNITAPPQNTTLAGNDTPVTTMNIGTIVGIAVGASLLFLGGIALFVVYWRKSKRNGGGRGDNHDSLPPKSVSSSITASSSSRQGHYTTDHKMQDSPELDLKGLEEQDFSSNAEYYDKLDKMMGTSRTRRPSEVSMENRPGNGTAIPAHPAYIPRAMGGRGSRNASPNPSPGLPTQPKSNKPDEYALQQYLNAAEDSLAITLPPPPARPTSLRSNAPPPLKSSAHSISRAYLNSPPNSLRSQRTPPATSIRSHQLSPQAFSIRSQQLSPPAFSIKSQQLSPPFQDYMASIQPQLVTPPAHSIKTTMISPPPASVRSANSITTPPPPPPPSGGSAISLSLPSVPRIRIPKKYTPPAINIQEATPLVGPGEGDMEISGPYVYPEERFGEVRRSPDFLKNDPNERIVKTTFQAKINNHGDIPIASGKSLLYG